MDLVRQVLDKQVIDAREEYMGKVDGIVLEMRSDGPPRVAFLEIGSSALAHRFSPLFGRWMEALIQYLGIGDGEPLRVPPANVLEFLVEVKVDVDARETGAMGWEQWVAKRIVGRIPGSGL
jgi:hypothetical protein